MENFTTDELDTFIRLKFQNFSEYLTRVLIGADGYNSAVRNLTVKDGQPLYTGTMTWRGIVPRRQMMPLTEPFEGGAGFQLVVGQKKNFWIMDAGSEELAWGGTALQPSPLPSASAQEKVLQVFEGWAAIVAQIIQATDATGIIETGVYDREPVSQWGDGRRVTLLGDAAHPIRPSLGLGSTLAFQDAVALARVLAGIDLENSTAVATALASYEQDRISITTPLQQKARQQGEASHAKDQAERLKAGFEAALANRRPS